MCRLPNTTSRNRSCSPTQPDSVRRPRNALRGSIDSRLQVSAPRSSAPAPDELAAVRQGPFCSDTATLIVRDPPGSRSVLEAGRTAAPTRPHRRDLQSAEALTFVNGSAPMKTHFRRSTVSVLRTGEFDRHQATNPGTRKSPRFEQRSRFGRCC